MQAYIFWTMMMIGAGSLFYSHFTPTFVDALRVVCLEKKTIYSPEGGYELHL